MKYIKEAGFKISIKDKQELAKMAEAGRILGIILSELEKMVEPGITTAQLNQHAENRMNEFKVRPAFKGYHGFPAVLCTCVNNEVVHGIPNDRALQAGDILTIDSGVIFEGFYSDSAITVPVGEIGQEAQLLIDTTQKALDAAIEILKPGIRTNELGKAIENVAKNAGFTVIEDLSGHGIGKSLHEDPYILNYRDRNPGPIIQAGMVFAIEPIFSTGTNEIVTLKDNWTIVTADNSLSAQIEHTVAVTEDGAKILTERPK